MSEENLAPEIEIGEGTPTPETPQEPANMRDDIANDVRAVVESLKDTKTDDRPRGPDGKFAPKVEAPEPEKAVAPEAKPITDPDTSKASEPAPSTAQNAPPVSWSAEAKAEWAKLPPAIQTAVLKRETEASDGFRQKSEQIKQYESVIQPVTERAREYGVQPDQFLRNMIETENALRRDPVGSLKWIAQQYGVDLSTLTSNQAPDGQPSQQAPDVIAPVLSELSGLKSEIETFKLQAADQSIKEFEKNPEHKYFQDVRQDMARLINSGEAKDLKEAYDKAIWLNQTVRDRVLADREAKAEADRKQALKERAQKATQAAVSVRGAPAGAEAPKRASVGDARDDVRAVVQSMRGDA